MHLVPFPPSTSRAKTMKRQAATSSSARRLKHARRVEEDDSDDSSEQPTQTRTVEANASDEEEAEEATESESEEGALDFTQSDYAAQLSAESASQDPVAETKTKAPSMPSKVGQMTEKTIEDLTAQLVRYMLYKASLKHHLKFSDISKEVFPKYKNVSRYFFQKAKERLEKVFGYRVVPVDDSSSKELYLIINSMPSQEHHLLLNKNSKSCSRGLLMMILGILWCAPARQLAEEELWRQLLHVDPAIKPNREHPTLGDVSHLLKQFETQMYLQGFHEIDADLKRIKHYSFGPRALLEIGKVQILNFVCQLITGRPPSKAQLDELALESK